MGKRRGHKNSFVIGSKVRDFVRAHDCFAGSDLFEALNRNVEAMLARGVERARGNKRRTVRSHDV